MVVVSPVRKHIIYFLCFFNQGYNLVHCSIHSFCFQSLRAEKFDAKTPAPSAHHERQAAGKHLDMCK